MEMEAFYPEVAVEMAKLLYAIDRRLYSILLFNLQCDPRVSMLTIGFWICLEHITLKDVVTKMLPLSFEMIDGLFGEAMVGLGCIANTMHHYSHAPSEFFLTQHLLGQHICLKYLYENQAAASDRIKKICVKALKDLKSMAINNNALQHLAPSEVEPIDYFLGESSSSSQPGGLVPRRMPAIKAPKGRRTMFATSSKGFPVYEGEMCRFFSCMFGDCIDSITMQSVNPGELPLYALIVFTTPGIINFILNGTEKAKFSINGKQVWLRKSVPKF